MTSNRNSRDVRIVTSESAERHASAMDERKQNSGTDGVKIGYRWEDN